MEASQDLQDDVDSDGVIMSAVYSQQHVGIACYDPASDAVSSHRRLSVS